MNSGTAALIPTCLLFGVATGVGIYQHVVHIPRWFAAPPGSFEIVRQSASAEARFWIPVQATLAILLIVSLVLNWKEPAGRVPLLAAFVGYVVVWIATATYFAPGIIRFSRMTPDASWTSDHSARAQRWVVLSWSRPVVMIVANALILLALSRRE